MQLQYIKSSWKVKMSRNLIIEMFFFRKKKQQIFVFFYIKERY